MNTPLNATDLTASGKGCVSQEKSPMEAGTLLVWQERIEKDIVIWLIKTLTAMKQKKLTKEQEEIVARLHDVLAEADAADIGLAFDTWDKTLHAFNAENVSCNYGCIYGATENDENLDLEKCLTMEIEIEPYNSQCGNFILEFEE